ncbi:hypothetical protein V8E53_000616 [Lactarius tabidus]
MGSNSHHHPLHIDLLAFFSHLPNYHLLRPGDDGSPALSAPSSLPLVSAAAQHRGQATVTARPSSPPLRSRLKHILLPCVLSDDRVDSPTSGGDIGSSTTVGRDRDHPSPVQPHSVVTSTLPSPTPYIQDLPTVVTVIPPPSAASSSDAEIEPAPAHAFTPSTLAPEDIQAFINGPPTDQLYADGTYSLRFLDEHLSHSLQLRQAKLLFPNVHLVDEVVPDTPWVIDAGFIDKYNTDYVAHDEEPYLSAGHEDVYSFMKSLGKFTPTRQTPGISTSSLLERIVKSYRKCDFDKKLEKMGHAELLAQDRITKTKMEATKAAQVGSHRGEPGVDAFVLCE